MFLDKVFAKDYVDHSPMPGQEPGLEGAKQAVAMMHSALSDIRISIEFMVAEGDMVVARSNVRATHTGESMGIPPNNKELTYTSTEAFRLKDGKIVERWENWDEMGAMRQLGVITSLSSSSSDFCSNCS